MDNGHQQLQEKPTAELVKDISDQATRLVRSEIELAKAELAAKGKQAGIGAGMFGGAGLLAVFGFGAPPAAATPALAPAVAAWLAALIVAVVSFATAGIAALLGKGGVQKATPPVPERALDSTRQD